MALKTMRTVPRKLVGIVRPHANAVNDSPFWYLAPVSTHRTLEAAAAAILVLLAIRHDLGAQVIPLVVLLTLIGIAVVYSTLPFWLYVARAMNSTPSGSDPMKFEANNVYCYGTPGQLSLLRCSVITDMFEPVITTCVYRRGVAIIWVCVVVAVGAGSLALISRGFGFLWFPVFVLLLLSDRLAWLSAWMIQSIRPVVFRVSPGLLEVVRARWFGSGLMVERRIPLEGAYLIIRFDQWRLLIVRDRERLWGEYIPLDGVTEPHRFAVSLASAIFARDKHEKCRLSPDSMTG